MNILKCISQGPRAPTHKGTMSQSTLCQVHFFPMDMWNNNLFLLKVSFSYTNYLKSQMSPWKNFTHSQSLFQFFWELMMQLLFETFHCL